MSETFRTGDARAWTALACLIGLLATVWAPTVAGQVGVYTIEGEILDPSRDPVPDATVELFRPNSTEPSQTTQSGEEGTYRFRTVEEGRWDLVARHPSWGPDYRTADISGMPLVQEIDLQLSRQGDASSDEPAILRGRTVERGSDRPVPGVDLRVQNGYETGDGERREERIRTRSAANGTYAIEVQRGWVEVTARAEGYDITEGDLVVEDDRRIDVPMRPTAEEAVHLSGTLTASDGSPIADAHVRVEPDRQARCQGRECPVSISARDGGHVERDGVDWRIRSAAEPYASTRTAENGSWELSTREGELRVSAWAEGLLPADRRLEAEAGQHQSVNLTLEPIPPDSVTLQGTVRDAESGDPIPHAEIQSSNHAWGVHERNRTDADGRYRITTKPGYTIVRVEADETILDCGSHPPTAAPARDGAGEGDEGARETSASPLTARSPPPCDRDQRDQAYRPRSLTMVPEANETRTLDVSLERVPAPSATLEGWVVNTSSEEGIANASLSLVNEDTGARGRAQADKDGSFTIDVPRGYYTVRARAQGYFTAVENVLLAEDETRQIAVELTPGTPRYGRCCVVYDVSPSPEGGRGEGTAGADAGPATSPEQERGVQADRGTPELFEGRGGGLGPYDAEATTRGDDGAASTPAVGAWGAVVLVGLAAIVHRRRDQGAP